MKTLPSAFLTSLTTFFPDSPTVAHENALANAVPAPDTTALKQSASQMASALHLDFPDPSRALLAQPLWWWQSGSTVDALLTYSRTTSDPTYQELIQDTLRDQATPSNDFMTPDATGNDDQAWWALAALTAAENGVPTPPDTPPWTTLAQNVFDAQKKRWDTDKCNGGMKWKIDPAEADNGWHYKSSIANGLFFQLAARLGAITGDNDTLTWAEKAYDWVVDVGLIDSSFHVFDGTDDAKGDNGCIDVNHDKWSYNVGVFMYGSAVLAQHTGEPKWTDRASGFVASAKRSFIKDGQFFEAKCDADASCDTDQVSFKGALARWMGGTAALVPATRAEVANVVYTAADKMLVNGGAEGEVGPSKGEDGWSEEMDTMEHFTALQVVDAAMMVEMDPAEAAPAEAEAEETAAAAADEGMIGMERAAAARRRMKGRRRRSVAGRVWM